MGFKKFLAVLISLMFSTAGYGGNNNANNLNQHNDDQALADEAVKKTQDLLTNSDQRKEVIKADPKAKSANDKVLTVTGGDDIQTQKIYNISAEILPILMKEVENNPNKAAELLQKAQKDPAAFLNSLPENIRNQIRNVSADIERKNSSGKVP